MVNIGKHVDAGAVQRTAVTRLAWRGAAGRSGRQPSAVMVTAQAHPRAIVPSSARSVGQQRASGLSRVIDGIGGGRV